MAMKQSKGVWMSALGIGGVAALLVLGAAQVSAETETKPAPESRSTCVDVNNAVSRRVVGRNKMLIEDGFGRSALITLSQPCSNIDELDMIGFEFFGSDRLCGRMDMKILHSRNGERPVTCLITDIKFMNREETKRFDADEKAASKAS